MVAGHVLHGARSQDAHSIELAAVQQHLGETVVVVSSAHQPTAAAVRLRFAQRAAVHGFHAHRLARLRIRAVQRGEARSVLFVDEPGGLVHAQWLQQPGAHELIEALAGDDFQHPAEHVETDRVVPLGARLEQQWQRRPPVDDCLEIEVAGHTPFETGLAIHGVDRMGEHEPVGQPAGVREQMPQAHLLDDRIQDR